MSRFQPKTPADARTRLVEHVQHLERLEEEEARGSRPPEVRVRHGERFERLLLAALLRRHLPQLQHDLQRHRVVAFDLIYLAALGMLEGDPLTDEARRRLDPEPEEEPKRQDSETPEPRARDTRPPRPEPAAPPAQPALELKDPAEARAEGEEAAAAGKRIYDNPYPAGDPCRAAWDEGWCAKSRSHGMDTPSAYQRRTTKKDADKDDKDQKRDDDGDIDKKDVA